MPPEAGRADAARGGDGRLAPLIVAGVLALAVVALVQGLGPGMLDTTTLTYFGEGSTRCLHDLGLHAFTSWCHSYAEPAGFPLLTGGPVIVLGALLMYIPGVDSLGGFVAAQIAFTALALFGGYVLVRRLGGGRWVALGTSVAYAVSPSVIGMEGFGGTFTGFVLLPLYAAMDVLVMDALRTRAPRRRLALLVAAYVVVRTGALFMDGYSFVGSLVVSACLWVAWALHRDLELRRRASGAAIVVAGNVVALVVYLLYVPVPYPVSPIEVFRSMGLDVTTIFEPSQYVWWATKLGVSTDHAALWGDSSNSMYNYAGLGCVVLAVWYLARRPRHLRALALVAAGLIALVLSFGPALKTGQVRPPAADFYSMPQGLAPELPWDRLLTTLPGLKSMRATYRWFGVVRLALVVLAGLGVAEIARSRTRRWRIAAAVLGVCALIDLLPTVPYFVRRYRAAYHERVGLMAQVEPDLQRLTRPGERVFFLNYTGSPADFLVNDLAPPAHLRAYNVGGDKNLIYAMSEWPKAVAAIAAPGVTPAAVERALRSGKVDAVIAPWFDPHADANAWPPPPATVAAAHQTFAPILADPALAVRHARWFATLRLKR